MKKTLEPALLRKLQPVRGSLFSGVPDHGYYREKQRVQLIDETQLDDRLA